MVRKFLLGAAILLALQIAAAAIPFWLIPRKNTDREHFDVVIALGHPALSATEPDDDGRERTAEAVREYRRGVAPKILVTGGAAHNPFVEARAMSIYAQSLGVPAEAILEEDRARDTVENIAFAAAIMQEHGMRSAEVVNDASHLPRTCLLLSRSSLEWRTHQSRFPDSIGMLEILFRYWSEGTKIDLSYLGFSERPRLHR